MLGQDGDPLPLLPRLRSRRRPAGATLFHAHVAACHDLLKDWTSELTLFPNGLDIPDARRPRSRARGVKLVTGKVAAIDHQEGRMSGLRLESGETVPLDAMFGHPRTAPSSSLHEALGVEMVEGPIGPYIKVDEMQQTSVKGVYAAGDVAAVRTNVTFALAGGAMAGIAAHQSLLS